MTIRQFRIFIAVASSESISRAAEELYLTQPTVSAAIREIERHYGTRFFERINQRLRITEAGKELLNYAVHLMDLYDEIENVFQNPDSAGVLRVGATPNIGSFYLPELIAEFQEAFPQIRVNVRVGPTEQVEKTLLDSSLDLAVAGGIFHSPLIEQTPLFHERYEAVCSPGHVMAGRTVTLSEFMEQPLLFRERDSGSFVRKGCGAGLGELFSGGSCGSRLQRTRRDDTSAETGGTGVRKKTSRQDCPVGFFFSQYLLSCPPQTEIPFVRHGETDGVPSAEASAEPSGPQEWR